MKVYEAGTRDFNNNGLGMIFPLKCIEEKRKSLNGWTIECEVELKYNDIIQKDNIIVVDTKEKGAQAFLINEPSVSNTISFTADHIFFSSQRYMLADARPTNLIAYDFLEWINERTDTKSPFLFYSNIPSKKTKYFIRKNLLEALQETEILYDGVFDIDMFNVNLYSTIGKISDVSLIYGKNMEGIKKYETWDHVCTKVLPVGPDELILDEVYIESDVRYTTPYTKSVTFDIDKEKEDGTEKTKEELIIELKELANRYLNENKYPLINYTVTANVPQDLHIGDIVPVKHPIAIFETEVQAYKYDILTKKVLSIEYGNYERSVKKAFSNIKAEIQEISKKSDNFLIKAKNEMDYLMNVAGKNGSIVFRKNENGVIYEVLAMDTNDIETAKTILRFNSQGIAGTDKGINGEFNVGMMSNGTIVADMIKAGVLQGIEININDNFTVDENGKLKSIDGEFNGKVTAITGNIAGFDLTDNGFAKTSEVTLKKVYDKSDSDRIKKIIAGQVSPTSNDYYYYDVDGNGKISASDLVIVENYYIKAGGNKIYTDIVVTPSPFSGSGKSSTIVSRFRGTDGNVLYENIISPRSIESAVAIFNNVTAKYGGFEQALFEQKEAYSVPITVVRNKDIAQIEETGIDLEVIANGTTWAGGHIYVDYYNGTPNLYIITDNLGYLTLGVNTERLYLEPKDGNYSAFFRPRTNGMCTLGSTDRRFYCVYLKLSPNVSSDRRLKSDLTEFDERYVKLYDMLKPMLYRLKGLSDKKSKLAGFIAQDVELAMKECNIDKREFGIVKYDEENDEYALIYDMFIPLIIYCEHQKEITTNNRLKELEDKIDKLLGKEVKE